MADRLQIYQGALRLLGPSELASLSEDRPERHKLDAAWTTSVDFMIEQGLWNFAIRTVQLQPDADVEDLFGYDNAFSKPRDWVRTASISPYPTFQEGVLSFEDQVGYWYANEDPIYVQYVSNGTTYGWNVGAWRQSFSKALETYLAFECGLPIAADRGNRDNLYQLFVKRLANAKTKDAVDERVRQKPPGTWTRSRNWGGPGSSNRG